MFIGHASHELQTPLAVCQNRLEILLNDPQLTEKQLQDIVKARQTLDYATKLNKTLLLLSKIENRQFYESQDIEVNELIKRLLKDYSEIYSGRQIDYIVEEKGNMHLYMDDTLASVLFSNLIKNAFIHNIEGGKLKIFISTDQIIFVNTGNETPLDTNKIFMRFYHESKDNNSMGLGLSLVYSICQLYGITLSYNYENKEHFFILHRKKQNED